MSRPRSAKIELPLKVEIGDSRFRYLVPADACLMKLAEGGCHSEGPVYIPTNDSLVWSDVVSDRLLQWQDEQVIVVRSSSCYQNGNALDLKGRIVACSHGYRAIVRQDDDGEWRILVDRYQGKRLNSPNDIVVKRDGTLWFTDPPFGLTQANQGCGGKQEQPGSYVYRFDPASGEIAAVITNMTRPNGLAFSPSEDCLYVSDTSSFEDPELYHDIRRYKFTSGYCLDKGEVFTVINPGQPDGLCVDRSGNVFASSEDSVQIYASDSTYLGKMFIPEVCANVTLGGKNKNRLFIAAGGSLYAIDLNAQNA